MSRYLRIFAASLVVYTSFLSISVAQEIEEIVSAMQELVSAWEEAKNNQFPITTLCSDSEGYSSSRFSKDTKILRYDVKKTNSIIYPYQGIVYIVGVLEDNYESPNANNNGCFTSRDEAASTWGVEDITPWPVILYDMEVHYEISADKVVLLGSNMLWVTDIKLPHNSEAWSNVITQAIRPQ
jgi:hypothetical protein